VGEGGRPGVHLSLSSWSFRNIRQLQPVLVKSLKKIRISIGIWYHIVLNSWSHYIGYGIEIADCLDTLWAWTLSRPFPTGEIWPKREILNSQMKWFERFVIARSEQTNNKSCIFPPTHTGFTRDRAWWRLFSVSPISSTWWAIDGNIHGSSQSKNWKPHIFWGCF